MKHVTRQSFTSTLAFCHGTREQRQIVSCFDSSKPFTDTGLPDISLTQNILDNSETIPLQKDIDRNKKLPIPALGRPLIVAPFPISLFLIQSALGTQTEQAPFSTL